MEKEKIAMERRKLLTGIVSAAGAGLALGVAGCATDALSEKPKAGLPKSANPLGPNACVTPKGGPQAGYLPNVALIDQNYYRARFYDDLVMGKKVILSTFSTRNQSPMQLKAMATLAKVQDQLGRRLGRDVFMYSITYDPVHDTPEVLHKYARQHGVKARWLLLTGQQKDVNLVLARIGLGYMKTSYGTMPPHFGILRIGNEALSRWTQMPAVYSPAMILERVSFVEALPERKNPHEFVRGGPPPRSWVRSQGAGAHRA
jgi:protein SCO1